ncbi:DUF721 domain-containing protein [Psychromicrobium lacuslunae]|uniref:DUF721 domain-containing protein n=1 Tax=Psychromicrobium lacuslunae TaxID=1618207 RepID=UPI0009E5FB04|nr:DciA family protein [Psychromicrobium lacuslunae]
MVSDQPPESDGATESTDSATQSAAARLGNPDSGTAETEELGEQLDAAQAALNRMRQAASARGERRVRSASAHRQQKKNPTRRNSPGQSARDPQGLGGIIDRMVAERGWTSPVAVGSVMAQWDSLVGTEIAAHCQPESFEGTVLHVRCDSTSWATQLRLLSTSLLARFDSDLGSGVVTKIHVLAPTAPNWRKGSRTVNGRGPRDTYG